jgi:formate dehydrogenase major subunit
MSFTRRQFFRLTGAGVGATSLTALGFSPDRVLADVRTFKLARTTETRGTCPYCSVSCGVILYSLGDRAKNAKSTVIHVEGDPENPINRGTLCPKGASLLDFIKSPNRLKYPEYRAPGSDKWERVTWDWALDRIAKNMKADRDANFVAKNAAGVTVNRWASTAILPGCAASNETGYLTVKMARALGMTAIDTQARI